MKLENTSFGEYMGGKILTNVVMAKDIKLRD